MERRTWQVPSRLTALGPIRAEMLALARDHGFDEPGADDFALLVHEALSNAIVHGNGDGADRPVLLRVDTDGDALHVTVRDEGDGFDVAAVLRPALIDADNGQPRGRGTRIIRSLADEYAWRDGGREVWLMKRRDG